MKKTLSSTIIAASATLGLLGLLGSGCAAPIDDPEDPEGNPADVSTTAGPGSEPQTVVGGGGQNTQCNYASSVCGFAKYMWTGNACGTGVDGGVQYTKYWRGIEYGCEDYYRTPAGTPCDQRWRPTSHSIECL